MTATNPAASPVAAVALDGAPVSSQGIPGAGTRLSAPGTTQLPGGAVEGKSAAPPGIQPRSWTIEMPAGMELLNANQRPHWAEKGRIVKGLRHAAWACARRDRIPALERVRITVEYQPPVLQRPRDAGNWAPTGKALIDGIRDARVLPDDDSLHVLSETYQIGEPYPKGRIVLTITEVTGVG